MGITNILHRNILKLQPLVYIVPDIKKCDLGYIRKLCEYRSIYDKDVAFIIPTKRFFVHRYWELVNYEIGADGDLVFSHKELYQCRKEEYKCLYIMGLA